MAADAAIRGKLSEAIGFPAGLKQRISATGKVARPVPRSWWRRPAWLALAASVVLLANATDEELKRLLSV